jgi:hypothetical protein
VKSALVEDGTVFVDNAGLDVVVDDFLGKLGTD